MLFRALLLLPTAALGLLMTTPSCRAQEPPSVPPQEELEWLGRGPVHEAYAQPVESQPKQGPVILKEPPVALDEDPPDQRPETISPVSWELLRDAAARSPGLPKFPFPGRGSSSAFYASNGRPNRVLGFRFAHVRGLVLSQGLRRK